MDERMLFPSCTDAAYIFDGLRAPVNHTNQLMRSPLTPSEAASAAGAGA
jgi:hypothetical protein